MKKTTYVHPLTALGKRCMDITIALTGLLITLPLLPLIALAIKLESPGPVIFQQICIGYQKDNCINLFMMKKFRTANVNNRTQNQTNANDPNFTRTGRFLHNTYLDKLPQLWNVLAGDMSIVGPCPERPGTNREDNIPFYTERTYGVIPGIIGLAQVTLGYDEMVEEIRNKAAYDHAYALALSNPWEWLKMDLFILFRAFTFIVPGHSQQL